MPVSAFPPANLQYLKYNPTPAYKGQFSTDFQRKVGVHYEYNFVRSKKKYRKEKNKKTSGLHPLKKNTKSKKLKSKKKLSVDF